MAQRGVKEYDGKRMLARYWSEYVSEDFDFPGLHAVSLHIDKLRLRCLGRSIKGFVRHRQTRMGAFIVATHGLVMHTGIDHGCRQHLVAQ